MPAHLGAVPGRQPQQADSQGEACEADTSIGSVVVAHIRLHKHDGRYQGDQNEPAGEQAPFGWHDARLAGYGPLPQGHERCCKPTEGEMP